MKNEIDDLAIFGGPPLFSSVKPVGQLSVPGIDDYLELLKGSFERRELTDNGSMVRMLEERLRIFHGVTYCVCVVNACVGLVMLMRIIARGRRGNVIIPAFSY
ncbi:MAG: DegT/DnrJ/EryC1/StrS family aminotransferase, partial [Vulcanimicrobiaceae bacterium]